MKPLGNTPICDLEKLVDTLIYRIEHIFIFKLDIDGESYQTALYSALNTMEDLTGHDMMWNPTIKITEM